MSSATSPNPAPQPDIETQLDELLAQLMRHEPQVVAPVCTSTSHGETVDAIGSNPAAAPVQVHPASPASRVEASSPADSRRPLPTPHDDGDEELASQIQAMLDDARQAESAIQGGPAVTASASTSAATPASDPISASAPESSAQVASPAVSIEAIDELLADGADDAVAGDFETVEQVLTPEPLATTSTSTSASAKASAPPAAKAASGSAPAPPPSVQDVMNAPPAAEASDDPDLVAGSFEAPEDLEEVAGSFEAPEHVLSGSDKPASVAAPDVRAAPLAPAALAAGSAAAVAAELSESSRPAAPQPRPRRPRPTPRTVVVTCDQNLRRVLGTVNRPLDHVSPGTRNLIGWLGLVTLFNGSAMLIWSMLHIVG